MTKEEADTALTGPIFDGIPVQLDAALAFVEFDIVKDVDELRIVFAEEYPDEDPAPLFDDVDDGPEGAAAAAADDLEELAASEAGAHGHDDGPDDGQPIPDDARGVFMGLQAEPVDPTDSECEDWHPAEGVIFVVASAHENAEDLQTTIFHEIAHALGHTEDETSEMGLDG